LSGVLIWRDVRRRLPDRGELFRLAQRLAQVEHALIHLLDFGVAGPQLDVASRTRVWSDFRSGSRAPRACGSGR
jgi:hypothetical protein